MVKIIQVDKVIDAEEGDLRVWWIRNPPSSAEFYLVDSCEEATRILRSLAKDDLSDLSVESNAGGMEEYEDGDWTEWCDLDTGDDIDSLMEREA